MMLGYIMKNDFYFILIVQMQRQIPILNPFYFDKCFALHDRRRKNQPIYKSARSVYHSECLKLFVPDYPKKGNSNPWVYQIHYFETLLPEGVYYDIRYREYFITVDLDGTVVYHTPYGSGLNPEEISPDMTVPRAILDSPIVRHYREIQPVKPTDEHASISPEDLMEQEPQEGDDDEEPEINFAQRQQPSNFTTHSQQQPSAFSLFPQTTTGGQQPSAFSLFPQTTTGDQQPSAFSLFPQTTTNAQ